MTLEKELKQISFVITHVEVTRKTLAAPEHYDEKPEFSFEIGVEITINENEKQSMHTVHTTIRSKTNNEVLGNVTTMCIFNIFNLEEISVLTKEGNRKLERQHLDILNSVAIGTARGIIYSEFRGTYLHNAILPIVDIKAFQLD